MEYLKRENLLKYLELMYPDDKFEYGDYVDKKVPIYWLMCNKRHFCYCYQQYNDSIEIIVFDGFDYNIKLKVINAIQIMRDLKLERLT